MAASFSYPTSAYPVPSSSTAYQTWLDYMRQAEPIVYSNMSVAPPGLVYPMTLPGYSTPGVIQRPDTTLAGFTPSGYPESQTQTQIQSHTQLSGKKNTHMQSSASTTNKHSSSTSTSTNAWIQKLVQVNTPVPSITPNREWLLEMLKRYIFTNKGIMIGDYPKYEIRKKDITDKFLKRVVELYPRDKYNITTEWLADAMANLGFLPEYADRLKEFPSNDELRVVINEADFHTLAQDIKNNVEQYFKIYLESNAILENNVIKFAVHFINDFVQNGQRIVFFINQTYSTTTCGIPIPESELKHQHDFLTYDGNIYSVLDSYANHMLDAETYRDEGTNQNNSIDNSVSLFEIVNNIRNGITVFMAYVEIDDCIQKILAARNIYLGKKEKNIPVFDRFILPRVKLDYYIKIWKGSSDTGTTEEANCICARCNVVIESDELVCTTKCCRQTMHSSCLLELYIPEDCKHSAFKCEKCNIRRRDDKYGRNTEMLLALCF